MGTYTYTLTAERNYSVAVQLNHIREQHPVRIWCQLLITHKVCDKKKTKEAQIA